MTTTATHAAHSCASHATHATASQGLRANALLARASSLALATVLTLAMLAGVDTLAIGDGAAVQQNQQLVQVQAPRG